MSEFLDEFCFQYPRYTSLFLHCSSNNSKTVSASGNTRALKSGFTINLNLWRAKMRLSTPFVKKTKSSQWRQRQLSSSVMELSKWTHSYFFKGLVLWQLVDSMRTPEMCRYPQALFDSTLLPRKANKPVLAEAIWARTKNNQTAVGPTGDVNYVLDGGALLHRLPWPSNSTYSHILSLYVQYVKRRYNRVTIVFDGYENGPSTKDCAHQRGSGICGPTVGFDCDMVLKLKKDVFLSNPENKQRFINFLGEQLQLSGCTVIHSSGDADLEIAQAAEESSKSIKTVLVGDDTDLLVVLCHYVDMSAHDLFFIPQPKPRSNTRKVWNIKETVSALGPEICTNILFLDAILGCDTTSALHGIGKGQALKKIKMDAVFRDQASVFSIKDWHPCGRREGACVFVQRQV